MDESTELKKQKIVWTPINIITTLLFSIGVLGFCSIWLCLAFWMLVFDFKINNVSTAATVTEKKVIEDDEDGPCYMVQFEYDVNGTKYQNSASCSKLAWKGIKPGDEIRIRYFAPMAGAGAVLDK